MAKSKSSKLKSHKAGRAWKMAQAGDNYKDIAEAVGHTVTAVKLYIVRKYKDESLVLWSNEIRAVGCCEIQGCNRTENLQAHHILKKSTWLHLSRDLSNGVCLCGGHHTMDDHLCPHGSLPAVEGFLRWLEHLRPGQYTWYKEHKEDERYQEIDYEVEYYRLLNR